MKKGSNPPPPNTLWFTNDAGNDSDLPPHLINVYLTEKELDVLLELANEKDVSPARALVLALRIYQIYCKYLNSGKSAMQSLEDIANYK